MIEVDREVHMVSQTETNSMEYLPKVPWGMAEIVQFTFIVIFCFLVHEGFRYKLQSKPLLSIAIDIAMLLACFLFLKLFILAKYNKGLTFLLGSNLNFPNRKKLALLLGLFFAVLFLVQQITLFDISKPQPLNSVLNFAIFSVVLAPWIEELWFRSFIYRGLRKTHGVVISVCVSSLLFAAYHPYNFSWPIMIIGPMLALYYEKTGSLVGCVLAHLTGNLVYLLFLVILPIVM
jgi:membrane protease YdiL (CAAX protease family)